MGRSQLGSYESKKFKYSVVYYLIVLFLCITLITGCFYNYVPEPADSAVAQVDESRIPLDEAPQIGGELRVPLPEPNTLNPLFADTKGLSDFLGIMFEGLFKFGKDDKPIPVLAQSWEVTERGRVWHIRIQEGVRFHDGYELTAEDVIFTFNALQAGLVESYYGDGIFGNPDLETMIMDEYDPHALYVHLFEPINNLTELLTFPILPKHVYQTDVFMAENKGDLSILPVGTGPFRADAMVWGSGVNLRLVRNVDWWGDKPFFDSVKGIIYEDEVLARSAFLRGEIDIFDSVDLFANIQTMGRAVRKRSYLTNYYEFIGFNFKNPIFTDGLVRRAIEHALDRRQIISTVYNGAAQDAQVPILPTSWLYRSGHFMFEADTEKASHLLEKAGFTGIDENGVRFRITEGGTEQLKFRLLTNLESALRKHAQLLIAQQLEAAGIAVEIQVLPLEQFVAALREHDFDMVIMGFDVGRFPDLSFNIFLRADEPPLNLYSSDALNSLLNEAKRAYEQETLKQIYGDIQEYISGNQPVVGLYFRTASVFFNERLEGVETPLTSDIYNGIEKWYFDRME